MIEQPVLTDSLLRVENRVATLTFNRHDIRNALTGSALVDDILNVAQWVNTSHDVSVLVITGAGSAFSAGGNIHDMAERKADFAGNVAECEERYRRGIQRMPLAMQDIEVPVIAAVNGAAVGAGFDLANMCDIRIASDKAKMGETFLNLGIIPGDGGAWLLQRLVGYQRAFELTMTGRLITGEEAKELGLVMDVVPQAQLMEETMKLAASMASQPPKATRLTKRLLKMAQKMEMKEFLDVCACFQGMCHNEPEHLEAVNKMLTAMGKR